MCFELSLCSKKWLFLAIAVFCTEGTALYGETFSSSILGKFAPTWQNLAGTDGLLHSFEEIQESKVTLVVFLCNHCPCAKGYETRFKDFVAKYQGQGMTLVAFNCDSSESIDAMKQRATESQFNFQYLRDETQKVARSFGARTTPHVFVLDKNRKVVFSGAFDDDMRGLKIRQTFVADAVEDLLAGRQVKVTESRLCGCKIHYED
jgi:peroxiredoxin